MIKPVTILTLDDAAASLGAAVQERVAAACGIDELVQMRAVSGDAGPAIESIHALRHAPSSALRIRDDISNRELVLLVVSACGPARTGVIDVAEQVRSLYEMQRLAAFYSVEILCLLPGLFAATPDDYGAAYSLLKMASSASPRPFDTFWLLDSTNANRVKFGRLAESLDSYAEAVTGTLLHEPEMSGAPAAHRPRGMDPTFSTCGYAELFFPRDVATQRVEARFAAELVRAKLLASTASADMIPQLGAKQFVVADAFTVPLARIGLDSGQSLFRRFQAKTLVSEKTRNADEVIAAVRAELKVHRESTHTNNLHALQVQREQTVADLSAYLERTVDETLDRDDYASAMCMLEALLDPTPDVHADASVAPRNLVTEIHTATAAVDARLRFTPNSAASTTARKRIRELDHLLEDQQLVADVHASATAPEQLAAMQHEKSGLLARLPEVIFAEEAENNAARNAAADAESERLAEVTATHEQGLRELFAERPRAEQALREALEERRAFIWRQILWGTLGIIAGYSVPFALGLGLPHRPVLVGAGIFAIYAFVRYLGNVAPQIRAARENLERVRVQIDATDKGKNVAHNDELQFEYDVAHRRATIAVLRRTREAAKKTHDALRTRVGELEDVAASFVPASIAARGLSIAVIDDEDVDAWYERTTEDRKPLVREFPIERSESRHLSLAELRERVTAYAGAAFDDFRTLTIGRALTLASEPKQMQRLKRFADYSSPLIELRDDDMPAQQTMQRDVTLWIDANDRAFANLVRRRLPDAHVNPPADPLRVHAVSRVLHYPGYVLAQLAYYRAQYDPVKYPESADAPDLLPAELVLTGALRTAYEQVLLGRAVGVIRLRDDGRLGRASSGVVLGDSHLSAAQRLASSDAATLRHDLDRELAPRIAVARDVERDLRQLLGAAPALSPLDRDVIGVLLSRYASEF